MQRPPPPFYSLKETTPSLGGNVGDKMTTTYDLVEQMQYSISGYSAPISLQISIDLTWCFGSVLLVILIDSGMISSRMMSRFMWRSAVGEAFANTSRWYQTMSSALAARFVVQGIQQPLQRPLYPPNLDPRSAGLTADTARDVKKARIREEILAREAEEDRLLEQEVRRELQFEQAMAERLREVQRLGLFSPMSGPPAYRVAEPSIGDSVPPPPPNAGPYLLPYTPQAWGQERQGLVQSQPGNLEMLEPVEVLRCSEKMSKGTSLSDEDRIPWLEALRDAITKYTTRGENVTLTCSALQKNYRDILRTADLDCKPEDYEKSNVRFVCLEVPIKIIAARIKSRLMERKHFMPVTLLLSQFDLLEIDEAEGIIRVDVIENLQAIVDSIATVL